MALVELLDVKKTYNGASAPVQALRGIDLSFEERAFVALMGRSGSGKSTLLTILGAMSPPTGGRIMVDGIVVRRTLVLHAEAGLATLIVLVIAVNLILSRFVLSRSHASARASSACGTDSESQI